MSRGAREPPPKSCPTVLPQIGNDFDDVVAVVGEGEDFPGGINKLPFLLELADCKPSPAGR
jgi:hypothetical protein